jgi:hypothetical protein
LNDNVFPLFQAIAEFYGAVFNLVLRVMAGIWQNVLLPALQQIYSFLAENVFPIFQTIGEYLSETFQPIINSLASFVSNKLAPAFRGIVDAIKDAVEWIQSLAEKINDLALPSWLTPGSPTPWEIGLANNLNRVALAGGSASSTSSIQNDNIQVFGPVIMQGSTPAGSLGARLKGRRF